MNRNAAIRVIRDYVNESDSGDDDALHAAVHSMMVESGHILGMIGLDLTEISYDENGVTVIVGETGDILGDYVYTEYFLPFESEKSKKVSTQNPFAKGLFSAIIGDIGFKRGQWEKMIENQSFNGRVKHWRLNLTYKFSIPVDNMKRDVLADCASHTGGIVFTDDLSKAEFYEERGLKVCLIPRRYDSLVLGSWLRRHADGFPSGNDYPAILYFDVDSFDLVRDFQEWLAMVPYDDPKSRIDVFGKREPVFIALVSDE